MKVTKTELIRLARLAQKDIASGRVSKNAQQAVEALSDYQNSAIELLDLTLEEATKEQSDKSWSIRSVFCLANLWRPCASILSLAIGCVGTRRKCSQAVGNREQSQGYDPSTLLFLVQCFGAAKLDLGEDLRGVVERLLEEAGEASADEFQSC